jgi:amino-acid N-acetyltransferase
MANLDIDMAIPAQESLIRVLLAQHQLPNDDIAHHLRHFHVASLDDRVVGAMGLEIYRPFALVRSLVVLQDLWGQGIGRQLYNRSESYARQQGVVSLYLLTLTAPGFFGKHGFVEIDRSSVPDKIQKTREFAETCPASATCMVKYLNDSADDPTQ